MKMAANEERARVLVLGGTGFIGRNFVFYLVSNDLASKIRVADKVPPQMAWMNARHQDAFANPVVEFKHSNLISPASVQNAFSDPDGEFDYVVNLAAETKYGQTDPVYQEGIIRLSMNCAQEAERRKVKFYIELSSAQTYSSDKTPVTEDSKKCDPWTKLAEHKQKVEEELSHLTDLRYAVIRPAIVYGVGDRHGLAPRLIIGAIYKYIKQKMKVDSRAMWGHLCLIDTFLVDVHYGVDSMVPRPDDLIHKLLWTKDLRMNTVHVHDLSRAIWHVLHNGQSGHIYNCVDKNDTTQGKISEQVSQVFGISYDFVGSVLSNIARVNMSAVVEDINDKHMKPWADACTRDGIKNTPLNPFIDQELLYNKHLYIDGSKLEKTGFHLERPYLEITSLQEILEDYLKMGLFPPSLLSGDDAWAEQYKDDDLNIDASHIEDENFITEDGKS